MYLSKTFVTLADIFIPRIIQGLFETTADEKPKKVKQKVRKETDCTKYTQYMYDFIVHAYNDWLNVRGHYTPKLTQTDLAKKINERMGTNKSITSLRSIWSGKVDRDTLAKGKAYFEYL